jgi:cytidine deaminase
MKSKSKEQRQGNSKVKGQMSKPAGEVKDSELIEAAKRVASRAYAPYSRFRVGAALLTKSGKVFAGCNIENASYGLTICAERNAIFSAIAAGEREFEQMVIYTPTKSLTGPCGACRQVMAEFAPNLKVVLVNRSGLTRAYRLSKLLPERFALE